MPLEPQAKIGVQLCRIGFALNETKATTFRTVPGLVVMEPEISISVVIPARNAEATLARAIDSTLGQTYPLAEIIVVDDASTDATAAIARDFRDRASGPLPSRAREALPAPVMRASRRRKGTGSLFWTPTTNGLPAKLAKQVAAIRAHPEARFVFCASEEFSPQGQSSGRHVSRLAGHGGKDAWKALLACNFVATPTVVARRALLLQLGGFDESLKVAEDQDMWIRLALAGPPAYVPESLVRVHVRPESLSTWRLADQYAYTLPMIERHLARLRDRLSRAEARAIMGARLNQIGAVWPAPMAIWRTDFAMILRSAFLGYRPL